MSRLSRVLRQVRLSGAIRLSGYARFSGYTRFSGAARFSEAGVLSVNARASGVGVLSVEGDMAAGAGAEARVSRVSGSSLRSPLFVVCESIVIVSWVELSSGLAE